MGDRTSKDGGWAGSREELQGSAPRAWAQGSLSSFPAVDPCPQALVKSWRRKLWSVMVMVIDNNFFSSTWSLPWDT